MMSSQVDSQHTLYLFTHGFPFGYTEPFLETEIRYLAERFSRVVLMPHLALGAMRPVPDNVIIDTSLDHARMSAWDRTAALALLGVTSAHLYREIAERGLLTQTRCLPRAVIHLGKAIRIARWLRHRVDSGEIDVSRALFYTYWFKFQTLGVGLVKQQMPLIRLVSRGHGSDIYEERHDPAYLAFMGAALRQVDKLCAVSNHGLQYLSGHFPDHSSRFTVARLGVEDPQLFSTPSSDGVLRVVSCSSMLKVKRLDRVVDGLRAFAHLMPAQPCEWHHIGDGPERSRLESMANTLPASIRWRFHGQLANAEVLNFYRTHPVDIFVNSSESEGVPVSIMEAMSCGIPVIATAVGGNPEIVNAENGVVLSADPSPGEIGGALARFAEDSDFAERRRQGSKRTWETSYNARVNYSAFADSLVQSLEGIAYER